MRITVKLKLAAAFGVLVVLMSITAWLGISNMGKIDHNLEELLDGEVARLQMTLDLNGDLVAVVRTEKNLILATSKEEVDRSEIGLVFTKEPPKHDVTTFGIQNNKFEVPPGASRYEVVSMIPILHDSVVMSLFPHMHLRGRDFKYEAIYPDGRRETLLSVPQYDFNWQHTYRFETPLRIPQGTAHLVRLARRHAQRFAVRQARRDHTLVTVWSLVHPVIRLVCPQAVDQTGLPRG